MATATLTALSDPILQAVLRYFIGTTQVDEPLAASQDYNERAEYSDKFTGALDVDFGTLTTARLLLIEQTTQPLEVYLNGVGDHFTLSAGKTLLIVGCELASLRLDSGMVECDAKILLLGD